jgi:hypothetical protein
MLFLSCKMGRKQPGSADPGRQVSGVLTFFGNLLANSRWSRFLGGGDAPEDAVLRGSVVVLLRELKLLLIREQAAKLC